MPNAASKRAAGLQRQKPEQLAVLKGCQLQEEKWRTDRKKYFSSYSFTVIFRQHKESQQAHKKSAACVPFLLTLSR